MTHDPDFDPDDSLDSTARITVPINPYGRIAQAIDDAITAELPGEDACHIVRVSVDADANHGQIEVLADESYHELLTDLATPEAADE